MNIPDNNTVSFQDITGKRAEVKVDVSDYMAAADRQMSLTQYYNTIYPTMTGGANALEQFTASAGIRLHADPARGIPASNLKEIFHAGNAPQMGSIVRNNGADRQTVAGRILFPEILMQMINQNLVVSKEDYLQPWEAAIAMRTSVSGPRVDQPLITITAPEGSAAQPISQLAEPAVMIGITLGSRTFTIPTKSIGLEISDQALQSTTIDLVGLTLTAQARGERIRRIEEDMINMISGDVDLNIAATSFVNASTFDAAVNGTDKLTHKAYVKWLRANYQKMTLTHLLCDIDTAFEIEGRKGRPSAFNDPSARANAMPVDYTIENLGIPSPKLLLLPSSIVGANRIVGFDSSYAIQEITNVSASYTAIENFVLRRASAMRFDFGIGLFKMYDEAFTGVTIGA